MFGGVLQRQESVGDSLCDTDECAPPLQKKKHLQHQKSNFLARGVGADSVVSGYEPAKSVWGQVFTRVLARNGIRPGGATRQVSAYIPPNTGERKEAREGGRQADSRGSEPEPVSATVPFGQWLQTDLSLLPRSEECKQKLVFEVHRFLSWRVNLG